MAEQDPYAGITTVSPAPPPEAPAEAPPEAPPHPAPWEAKLAQLERLTQQLQVDNARLQATVETTQRLRPVEPVPPPEPQGPPARPQLGDFTDQATYDQAMETWLDQRVAHNTRQTLQDAEQQRARQAQEAELARTQADLDAQLHAREAALLATQPDYNQRAQQVASQMSPATYWAVRATGEAAPDLVLHLDAHPEVLQRLNQTQPHLLGLEVGRLLAQVVPEAREGSEGQGSQEPGGSPESPPRASPLTPSLPAPATRPPPPAPPQTVTGGGVVPPTGFHDGMDQRSYEAERKRQNPRLFRR